MKRVLPFLLTVCLVLTLLPVVSVPAKAAVEYAATVTLTTANQGKDNWTWTYDADSSTGTLALNGIDIRSSGGHSACFSFDHTIETVIVDINGINKLSGTGLIAEKFSGTNNSSNTLTLKGAGSLIVTDLEQSIAAALYRTVHVNGGTYVTTGRANVSGGFLKALFRSYYSNIAVNKVDITATTPSDAYMPLFQPKSVGGVVTIAGDPTTTGSYSDETTPDSVGYRYTLAKGQTGTFFCPGGYAITYDANGGSITPPVADAQSNLPDPLPSPGVKTGHSSAGWYTNAALTDAAAPGAAISADTTLYAKWTRNSYNLTLTGSPAIASVTASGTGVTGGMNGVYSVPYDTSVTVTAALKTGAGTNYTFQGWSGDRTSGNLSYTFTMPASPVALAANAIGGIPAVGTATVSPYALKGDCAVTVTGANSDNAVTLRDSGGNVVHTLAYNGGTVPQDGATYDVWVDGFQTSSSVTLNASSKTVAVSMSDLSFTATLDGEDYGAFGALQIKAGGTFYPNGASLPAGTYDVYLNGEKIGTTGDFATKQLAFYTVTFTDGSNAYRADSPFAPQIVRAGEKAAEPLETPSATNETQRFDGWNRSFDTAITAKTTIAATWVSLADFEAKWVISGETFYGTLDEALAAVTASGSGQITLQKNAAVTETATLPAGATLTVPDGLTVTTGGKLTNEGALINDGTISGNLTNNGRLTGSGGISGALTNTGSVVGGRISGNVTNSGKITGADITGTSANTGGTLADCIVGGNVTGGALTGYIYAKDGVTFDGVDASDATVCIKGGNERFAGLADESTPGEIVLNSDLILRNPITVEGELDLHEHSIRGQDGADKDSGSGASGVTPLVVGSNKELVVVGPGAILGGNGGSSESGSGGSGGHGIDASAAQAVTADEESALSGGHGGGGSGNGHTGGVGGTGIYVGSGAGEIAVEGCATGGNGGSAVDGATGGDGGDAIGGGSNAVLRETGGAHVGGAAGNGRYKDPVAQTGGGTASENSGRSAGDYRYTYLFDFALSRINTPANTSAIENAALTLVPVAGAVLPDVISLKMGSTPLEEGTDYTYDSATGNIILLMDATENVSITAHGYLTPNALVPANFDHLTGLEPDVVYVIEGAEYTADKNGKIVMRESWYGKAITLREKSLDGVSVPPAQRLDLAALVQADAPNAADFVIKSPTASTGENSVGKIEGIGSGYEYSADSGATWVSGADGVDVENLPAGAIVLVRVPGDATNPPSKAVELAVKAYRPGGGAVTPPANTAVGDSLVIVDSKPVNAGEVMVDSATKTTTTVVKQDIIVGQIAAARDNVTVIVPITNDSVTASAELVVKNIEDMAASGMALTVQVGEMAYELPAKAVDTAAIMAQLGTDDPALAPFIVRVTPVTDEAAQALVAQAVAEFSGELILPPMAFSVTASYGGKTVEIAKFSAYVSRTIEITAEQAARITTALVIEPDGASRHVPTEVFAYGGKWYARINSLTDSTYVLIFNESSFPDITGEWYEKQAQEMGDRKMITGYPDGTFAGGQSIIRAEFAKILVTALGLPANGDGAVFRDVTSTDWFAGAVGTAYEYGLVTGRGNGLFDPTASITRQEAMIMICNAAQLAALDAKPDQLSAFSDASQVADWAEDAVKFCVGSGLVGGFDGNIMPTSDISRAETATIVLRLLQEAGLVDKRS